MQKGFAPIAIVLLIAVVTLVGGGVFAYNQNFQNIRQINSFEECAKHYPVMTSYPAQCNTPDGQHFTQKLSSEEQKK